MNRWLFHCNQDIILENHFPLACAQSLGERAVGSKISISEELSKKRSSSIPHHYPCTHRHSKCSFIESVNKLKAQIVKKKIHSVFMKKKRHRDSKQLIALIAYLCIHL